jgi:osmotically-inducible protein OsmY
MGKTADVHEAVRRELDFDPLVDAAGIVVVNLRGAVALHGSVPSYRQYLAAGAAARRVAGVGRLDNHLEVVLSDDDYRDDPMLTTAANNALAQTVSVPPGIEAAARNGILTLTGQVSVGAQRAEAENAVAGLLGVRGIREKIEIGDPAEPIDVLTHVQDALDRYALVGDDSLVEIDIDDHRVTLTGNVRTWAERDAVVDAAWRAPGVSEVRDELSISR